MTTNETANQKIVLNKKKVLDWLEDREKHLSDRGCLSELYQIHSIIEAIKRGDFDA